MKWHLEWLPRVSLILQSYWDRKIEWRRGGWDGLWEGTRVKERIGVLWLKCSPDQQSEPSETWANSLFNPFSCFFSPSLSMSLLSWLTLLPSSLSLFTLSRSCPLSEGIVSKSSCWAGEEAGKQDASRSDSVCVSVCKCWLKKGRVKCKESWLCRLLLLLHVFFCRLSLRKAITPAVWFLGLSKVVFVSSPYE